MTSLCCIAPVILLSGAAIASDPIQATQWQVTEIELTAKQQHVDPFDTEKRLLGVFTGPTGESLKLVGFWDGEDCWKFRFTPTEAGTWRMRSTFEGEPDEGLEVQTLEIIATKPIVNTGVAAHGGFLKPAANNRYLTYSDGTPFFWLGDTWWAFPGENISIELYKEMVDKRVSQGFTTFQYHGVESPGTRGMAAYQAVSAESENPFRYWQALDPFIQYSSEKGLVGVVGFGAHIENDKYSLEQLKRLWSYYMARYGSYPLSILMTQEYNVNSGEAKGDYEGRVRKFIQLGRYLHTIDPYHRAMGIHPWNRPRDRRESWGEPWCSIRFLQSGHHVQPQPNQYYDGYFRDDPRPLIESEENYEGFAKGADKCDATRIRASSYTAMQSGAAGFTYGAQGLYCCVTDLEKPKTSGRWGPVLTIGEALKLPGADQLHIMAKFYQELPWQDLEPIKDATIPVNHGIASGNRERLHVVYAEKEIAAVVSPYLQDGEYTIRLFDPRLGKFRPVVMGDARNNQIEVPKKPDHDDWIYLISSVSTLRKP